MFYVLFELVTGLVTGAKNKLEIEDKAGEERIVGIQNNTNCPGTRLVPSQPKLIILAP